MQTKWGLFFWVVLSCCVAGLAGCQTTRSNIAKTSPDPEKIAQARETLGQVATVNDSVADLLYQQGLTFEEQGMPDQAIAQYIKAIKVRPSFVAMVYTQLGMVYAQTGQYDLARDVLEAAIAVNPGSALAHYQLGYVLLQKKDFSNAREALQKALAINPHLSQAQTLFRQLSPSAPSISSRKTLPAQRIRG